MALSTIIRANPHSEISYQQSFIPQPAIRLAEG
jgi:hypothetical protein